MIASKATRRLNSITRAERGILTTGCCIVCSNGTYLPPAIVFPRQNFKRHMLNGAPVSILGLGNKMGWMNSETFEKVMEYFVFHSNSAIEKRSLLIFDNHESHLMPNVINYACDHGVVIVTSPHHCSHQLQPLDVSIFDPFKANYN